VTSSNRGVSSSRKTPWTRRSTSDRIDFGEVQGFGN
jgi:hypothetical protein